AAFGLKFRMQTVVIGKLELAHVIGARVPGEVLICLQANDGGGDLGWLLEVEYKCDDAEDAKRD
ncbi:MAG: hypothetical protein L7F78_10555, partial [Syntrophales bacterium LBB04]|nr:hypothetical protein [Syntrophales bacterium LBB04]